MSRKDETGKADRGGPARPNFDEMARAVNASYLRRWAQHADSSRSEPKPGEKRRISAA
ncbi:MAG: hypothetical protein ACREPA_07435 [Candidatus Dormibacteraceae bacterium]